MKAKSKKAIAEIQSKIGALKAREDELQAMFDAEFEKDDIESYKALVNEFGEEYESIDSKIYKLRDEIRFIRDQDLIDRGYFHELNLARANID